MAVANYHDVHGRYPPPYLAGPDGRPWHSWRVLLLPYLEHSSLYDAYRFTEPWDGPHNRQLAERMPRVYAFHGWDRAGNTTTNYLAIIGESTVWPGSASVTSADVTDGLDRTILLVENDGAGVHWMEPRDLYLDAPNLSVNNSTGVSSPYDDPAVVTLDGTVRRLPSTVRPAVLRALLTIRGNEPLKSLDSDGWESLSDGRVRSLRAP